MNECSAVPDNLYSTFTPLPQRTDEQAASHMMMMMMMMMFFWHKYYYTVTIRLGGGATDKKKVTTHHSPLTSHSAAHLLVGPSIPTYLGGSTLPFYLQVSDLSRCVLFLFVAACHLHLHHHLHRRRRVCHQPAKREREGERGRGRPNCQQRRLAGNIFASSVLLVTRPI